MAKYKKTNNKKNINTKSAKKDRVENLKKINEVVEDNNTNIQYVVRVVAIIVIVFCAFYFLTLFLTNRDSNNSNTSTTPTDASISYSSIMAGRSFSMPEEEYLVLYYDSSNEDIASSMNTASNGYLAKESHLVLYFVDMADAINQKYIAETSNPSLANVSELSINGPTLIHFMNGGVSEYIEGEEAILNYFE